MADYENLLDSIDAVIKANNRREITGQILQNTLHQMVGSLGENYQLAGFATPSTNPNSPDQNVFYITDEAGVYTNFDNITLDNGLSFLTWKNGEWASKTFGIVTAQWVDTNYVSKAFLRNMFRFYDEDGIEIFANDTTSIVDNIKAMCGLWTEQYLSALGLNSDYSVPSTLAELNDVTITSPTDGQALVYDSEIEKWINATIQSGVDMTVVWAALAAATNEQINASHLSTALSGYVTTTALNTTLASYVTTTALNTALAGYASQSWVGQNYVSIAFFNSIFEAQDSNGTAIAPNNANSTTIDRLKILVGAFTEQYLSALGLSSGGSGSSDALADLVDVTISNPQGGQALIYDAVTTHWVNGTALNMSAVWTALADATNEQINLTHLTTALAGYVTSSSLSTTLASYVTSTSLTTTLADYVTATSLATTLASYATQTWVSQNYVSTAFFNAIFQLEDANGNAITPNNATTTKDRLKILVGAYTEQYLSALGLGSGGGTTTEALADLVDVAISSPTDGQALVYDATLTKWKNANVGANLNEPLSSINSAALGAPTTANVAIVWNGSAWVYGTTGSSYTLPTASASVLGGVKVGTTLAIDASGVLDLATSYLPLAGGTMTGSILAGTSNAYNIGSSTAKFYYTYFHRIFGVQSIESSFDGTYRLALPSKSGTIAVTSDIPTNNNQLTNGAGYITSSGSCNYATSAGNADTVDSLHASDFLRHYNDSALNANNAAQGWHDVSAVISNSACENHSSLIYVTNVGTPYQLQIPDASIMYIYKRYYTSGSWSSWGKIYAGYADSAGSVAWANVSGRPTSVSSFTNDSGYITSSGSCAYATSAGSAQPVFNNSTWYAVGDDVKIGDHDVAGALGIIGSNGNTRIDFCQYKNASNYKSITFDGTTLKLNGDCDYAASAGNASTVGGYGQSDFLHITGGTLTGRLTVPKGLIINSVSSDTPNLAYRFIAAYDSSYSTGYINFGYAASDGNCGEISYSYSGNASNDNYVGIGFYGKCPFVVKYSGNVGIGTSSPNEKLHVNGRLKSCTTTGKSSYYNCGLELREYGYANESSAVYTADAYAPAITFHYSFVVGNRLFMNASGTLTYTSTFCANGGVTALSDARHKDIIRDTNLSVEQIAQMPSVVYRWNDGREDDGLHVGSIAQNWQSVLPEVVLTANDEEHTLSMQYGVAACVSAITIAKRVVNHEARIKELEKENADLKQAYSFIKNAYEYLKTDYEQLKLKIA